MCIFAGEMAFIRPFRGWRYNPERFPGANELYSPLADVVNPAYLEQLYANPHNSIHVSVPRSGGVAKSSLESWKNEGVIVQDPLPAIYVYYQSFRLFGEKQEFVRKGFFAMIRTGTQGEIIGHEGTIAENVARRTDSLAETMLLAAPTHGLYEDPAFQLEAIMDRYMQRPQVEHMDYQGVINRMTMIQNPEEMRPFIDLLRNKKVYLADGHHRLATSESFQKRALASGEITTPDSMVNYHLMYLTNLCGNDLRILPIHRVVKLNRNVGDPGPLMAKIAPWFSITEITLNRAPVYEDIRQFPHCIGMVIGGRQFRLRLHDDVDPLRDIALDLPAAVKQLDYTMLHYFVLQQALGIAYDGSSGPGTVSYVKDYGTAIKQAIADPHCIAFILNGVKMQEVMDVCNAGAIMPPKSTYFYPKVECGFAFASIRDDENNTAFDACFRKPAQEDAAGTTGA